jgi:hypothetical protein
MSAGDDHTGGDGFDSPKGAFKVLFILALVIALYFGLGALNWRLFFPVALSMYALLTAWEVLRKWRELTIVDVFCETSFPVVLVAVSVGIYRHTFSFVGNTTFMFAIIFHRLYSTVRYNGRLALTLCLLVIAVVVPIPFTTVSDSVVMSRMGLAYALLIACLWVFCSKWSSKIFG